MAAIAQIKKRAFARADRASLQAVLFEIDRAEIFAVATVLPKCFDGRPALAFEVHLTQQVAAVFTPDRTLSRSEESSFVFGAKYSHFRSSLQRRVTVQVVLGAKHVMTPWGRLRIKDENNWREVCGYAHSLMPHAAENKS
ncbi:MAG TPA: hypothetical protein VEV42_03370 [Pyrinomonadaceae bacterium]|nr:hypothetical protein [Pyrinomonadaceae bacterium]